MQRPCKFCETMKFNLEWDEQHGRAAEYTVAIVEHNIIYNEDGTWRRRGRTTDYRYKGLGYKLKYCPECGTKLLNKRPIKKKLA